MSRTPALAVLLACLPACSENSLSNIADDSPLPQGRLEVTPPALDFGMLPDGQELVLSFTATNTGEAPVTVNDVGLDAPASFTIVTPIAETMLDPGDSLQVDVAFTPLVDGENSGQALVHSTDPNSPEIPVDLLGWSAQPYLVIDPNPVDFGATGLECKSSVDVYLVNNGLETLEIDAIDFATDDGAMKLVDNNALPLTLDPGGKTFVTVDFTPTDTVDSAGTLTVTSNDPRGPLSATQAGHGEYGQLVTDVFDKANDPPIDLLFAVDQSCSMDSHAASLATAFSSFIDQIDTVTSNWRIGVATADTGCFNSGFIDEATPNYETVFEDAVKEGTDLQPAKYGDTEKLFKVTDAALNDTLGGCNNGFQRPGALLHVILVSDEKEQSGTDDSVWLAGWLGYVPDPALLKVSAIVDVNGTCGDGSGPGNYDDMANATGGLVLDICGKSWADYTDDLAAASLSGLDIYVLTQTPDEASITVTVDGQAWLGGWHYDAATNEIVFDEELADGAHVEVTYGSVGCK